MSKYDDILEAIAKQYEKLTHELLSVNKRIDEINEFLERDAKRYEWLQKKQAEHSAQIAQLNEKVDELIKSRKGVIWEANDLSSVGIDKETARSAFHEIGLNQQQALTLLEAAGRLRVEQDSDGNRTHRTRNVRVSPTQVIRCVVVFV